MWFETNLFMYRSDQPDTSNIKFEDLPDLNVLDVINLIKNQFNFSQVWIDHYPGLDQLLDQWICYLTKLSGLIVDWDQFCSFLGQAWSWFWLFASQRLGKPQDWLANYQYQMEPIEQLIKSDINLIPTKQDWDLNLIRVELTYLIMPTNSIDLNFANPNSLFLLDWTKWMHVCNRYLNLLNMKMMNKLDNEDDEEGGDDGMCKGDELINSNKFEFKYSILWPLIGILMSQIVMKWTMSNPRSSMFDSIRIHFKSFLTILNRPLFLTNLVLSERVPRNLDQIQLQILNEVCHEMGLEIKTSTIGRLMTCLNFDKAHRFLDYHFKFKQNFVQVGFFFSFWS